MVSFNFHFASIHSCRCLDGGSAQLVHDHIDSVHVTCIGLGGVTFGQALVQLIHGGLVVADGGGESIDGLLAGSLVGVCCGESDEVGDGVEEDELIDVSTDVLFRRSIETYLILRLRVVLNGGSDRPRCVTSNLGLVVLEQLDEWGPETQRLQIVGIINSLNQLLEVVECDQLVLQIGLRVMDDFHSSPHQVGIGGPAEESAQHLWGHGLGGFGGIRGTALALSADRGLRVGDTPFEELVHFGIHGGLAG